MCHVPGPRGNSLGYFSPSRASSQCFSQASGASRSQHRLSSLLLTKDRSRGCNAVGCANTNEHTPTNTRNSFSTPEAVLSEVEQRFDCVQVQTHMYPSLVLLYNYLKRSLLRNRYEHGGRFSRVWLCAVRAGPLVGYIGPKVLRGLFGDVTTYCHRLLSSECGCESERLNRST